MNHLDRVKQIVLGALDRPPADRPAFVERETGGDADIKREVDSLLSRAADATKVITDADTLRNASLRTLVEMICDETIVSDPSVATVVAPAAVTAPQAEIDTRMDADNETIVGDDLPDTIPPAGGRLTDTRVQDETRHDDNETIIDNVPVAQSSVPTSPTPKLPEGPEGYELLAELGRGGMGVVWRARELGELGREVALKMIISGEYSSKQELDRFEQEARSAAKLKHDGVVRVHQFGRSRNRPYFTMDFVKGVSLGDHLVHHRGPLSPKEAARLVEQVAETIEYAHGEGVIHRDLKPANILLEERVGDDGSTIHRPRVADFGLAKQIEVTDENGQRELTITGQVMGSPNYMSPEQAAGRTREIGKPADIYALGAILYALLSGKPPFAAATITETLRQVQENEPVRLTVVNSSLREDKDLETICLKCLEKDANRRYRSAGELAAELRRYRKGEPILARPISSLERGWRWCRRNPALARTIGAFATFAVVAFVVLSVLVVTLNIENARAEAGLALALQKIDEDFSKIDDSDGQSPAELQQQSLASLQAYLKQWLESGSGSSLEKSVAYYRLGFITAVMGSEDAARQHYGDALAIQARLHQQRPKDATILAALGNTYNRLAESYPTESAERSENLKQAQAARQTLVTLEPGNLQAKRKLANVLMNLGTTTSDRGTTADDKPMVAGGWKLQRQAQEIRNAVLKEHRQQAFFERDLAIGYFNLANTGALKELGDEEQQAVLKRAANIMIPIARDDPGNFQNRYRLGIICRLLADVLARMGKQSGAQQYQQESASYYDLSYGTLAQLVNDQPTVNRYRGNLGRVQLQMGAEFGQYDYVKAAEASLRDLDQPEYRLDLIRSLIVLGKFEQQLFPDDDRWRERMEKASALLEELEAKSGPSKVITQLREQIPPAQTPAP